MNRPAPRKSQLAGQTPAAPAIPAAEAVAVSASPRASAPPPANEQGWRQDRATRAQLCAQVPIDLISRVRGVVLHTAPFGGPSTIAAFMTDALEAHAAALEAQFNEGEPFPSIPSGTIRTGRPPRSY